jgi:peroxiredoxin
MKQKRTCLEWLTVLGLTLFFAHTSTAAGIAVPGTVAPDFSLPDTDGKVIHLSDFKGKYVVLEWYNPDCPFVHKHYSSGNMQRLQKEFVAKGVVWLGIDSSGPGQEGNYPAAKLNEISARVRATRTALLMDPKGNVGRLYGAKTTPDMYVIGLDGKIVYAGAIDNKPNANIADVKGATNYVRNALAAVMAGKPVDPALTRSYGCSVKYAP